jgi:hypothetical protein
VTARVDVTSPEKVGNIAVTCGHSRGTAVT